MEHCVVGEEACGGTDFEWKVIDIDEEEGGTTLTPVLAPQKEWKVEEMMISLMEKKPDKTLNSE